MTWRMTYHPQRLELPVFLFDQQRSTCEACQWMRTKDNDSLMCGLSKGYYMACSAMRCEGEKCGPDALWFKARVGA